MKNIKRRENFLEKKSLLEDAAVKVFARKGFSESTIKDIAKEANVTSGLLYHYFSNKEEILWSVLQRYTLNNQIKAILSDSKNHLNIEDTLYKLVKSIFIFIREKSEFVSMFLGESQRSDKVKQKLSMLINNATNEISDYILNSYDKDKEYIKIAVRNTLTAAFINILFYQTNNMILNEDQYTETTIKQLIKILN
ncbi:TetR/AcrR family transcriptional regulator [Bacillus cereus]|uniref:TetR/AcrR family transcriptional regulator n=1 Tax=Bacillus cereus TaxID=1396 RepID=UPI000BFE4C22|nr:TetR/AcrR family transcriptional regulator [Bacillus cereus]PGK39833.1 hypothetical protein CN909_24380 [Bacillus cereus]